MKLDLFAKDVLNKLLPTTNKTWIYFILNFAALVFSLYGYFDSKGRLFGLLYTFVLGITLFAGIKSLEGENNGNQLG